MVADVHKIEEVDGVHCGIVEIPLGNEGRPEMSSIWWKLWAVLDLSVA